MSCPRCPDLESLKLCQTQRFSFLYVVLVFPAAVVAASWWTSVWKAALLGFVVLRDPDWLKSCFLLMSAMNSWAIQRNTRQTGQKRQWLKYMFINKYYSHRKKFTFFIWRQNCLTLLVLFAPQVLSVTVCHRETPWRIFLCMLSHFDDENAVFLIVWVQYFWSKQRKVLPVSWRFVAAPVLPVPSVACWSSVRLET